MTTASNRPAFDPVDTAFDPSEHEHKDDVESPSLSSSNALARFEFEPGRSKDGTKVLMVEWEDDDTTKTLTGDWEIRWEGKRTVLPARDPPAPGEEAHINRLYFLLGPGVSIPTAVKLQKGPVAWRTNPLPAIFSPELGATARQAGKKGVLHTIWAKKRLQVLQREIEAESQANIEGVGIEMAAREVEWIEQNFGVTVRPQTANTTTAPAHPASPRSPGGGRLMDKLKGLKLSTSSTEHDAGSASGENAQAHQAAPPPAPSYHNPLSPESADVAVGSFGSFAALKGTAPPPSSSSSTQQQAPAQSSRRIAAQRPPDSVSRQQGAGMGSLNAAIAPAAAPAATTTEQEDGDDLFALPMSPRSPDMTKSPFSFAAQDTGRYEMTR